LFQQWDDEAAPWVESNEQEVTKDPRGLKHFDDEERVLAAAASSEAEVRLMGSWNSDLKRASKDSKETMRKEAQAAKNLDSLEKMVSQLPKPSAPPPPPPSEQAGMEARFEHDKRVHDEFNKTVTKVAKEEKMTEKTAHKATLAAEHKAERAAQSRMALLKRKVAEAVVSVATASSSDSPDLVSKAKEAQLSRERVTTEKAAIASDKSSERKIDGLKKKIAAAATNEQEEEEEEEAKDAALARLAPEMSKSKLIQPHQGAKEEAVFLRRVADAGWENLEEQGNKRRTKLNARADDVR